MDARHVFNIAKTHARLCRSHMADSGPERDPCWVDLARRRSVDAMWALRRALSLLNP